MTPPIVGDCAYCAFLSSGYDRHPCGTCFTPEGGTLHWYPRQDVIKAAKEITAMLRRNRKHRGPE